jgi:transcription termination factor Rho
MYDIIELNGKKVAELREIASKLEVKRVDKLKKQDLVYSILDEQALQPSSNRPSTKTASTSDDKSDSKNSTSRRAPAKRTGSKSDKDSGSKEKRAPRSKNTSSRDSKPSKDGDRRSSEGLRERRDRRRKDDDSKDDDNRSNDSQAESRSDSRPEKSERKEKDERPERKDSRSKRDDRPARGDRDDRPARGDRDDRPARGDRVERPNRNDKSDKNDKNDRQTRNERSDRNNPNQDRNKNRPRPKADKFLSEPEEHGYNFDNLVEIEGVLEVQAEGYAILRSADYNYLNSPDDVYVSSKQMKEFSIQNGDTVVAGIRPPRIGEKFYPLISVKSVNGRSLEWIRDRVPFKYLTPLFPQEKFNLSTARGGISMRLMDLFSPIGKGQRGMIVSQPKTGKTTLLKDLANSISINHPEVYLIILLIDERPEEVTDMKRSVNGEVIASTFDEPADRHVRIANLVLEKAKRMVECGHDVCILLDSITRLARAYNTVSPSSGKILSGGVEANALQKPKRFFGAARNIENGGSLSIIATALVDTGSKMDEVIFEEFKGTGNMELMLDRRISNRRIYPAIDIQSSGTRREDLLMDKETLQRIWILRKHLADMNPVEAMEFVKGRIESTRNNDEFLNSMNG